VVDLLDLDLQDFDFSHGVVVVAIAVVDGFVSGDGVADAVVDGLVAGDGVVVGFVSGDGVVAFLPAVVVALVGLVTVVALLGLVTVVALLGLVTVVGMAVVYSGSSQSSSLR